MNILIAVASESDMPSSLAGSTERKNSKMVGLSIISRYANSSKRDSGTNSAVESGLLLPDHPKTQPPTPNSSFAADTSLPFSPQPPTTTSTATQPSSSSMIHALFASKGLSFGSGGVVSSQGSAPSIGQAPPAAAAPAVPSAPSGGLALLAMLSQGTPTIGNVISPTESVPQRSSPVPTASVTSAGASAALVNAETAAALHTQSASPVVHAQPAAPAHTEPAAPAHTEPAAAVHTESAAPAHTEPAAPAHTEPAAPAHTEPAAAVHAPAMTLGEPQDTGACHVIGIRPPRNDRRLSIQSYPPLNHGAAHCADAYKHYCDQFGVRINSRVSHILSQHDRYSQLPSNPFQDLTSLDVSLCMIRDKGFLPLLEIMRLCVNLTSVNLSDNDLTNEGIEYLAHAVTSGVSGSSFEVKEPNDGNTASPSTVVSSFGAKLVSIDVSGNRITLGGVRLLQLIAERIPTLVELKLGSAVHCDSEEIEILQDILSEH